MKLLKKFIYSVLAFLVFTACATTKHKLEETSIIKKDAIYSKHDSSNIKTINQPINDVVFLPLETGNSKIDSVIYKRLSNFKTYKKSGANSYRITYNKLDKGFAITSKIGQTENSLVKKLDSIKELRNKEVKKVKIETITKYRIPKWFLIVFATSLVAVYTLSKFRII